MDFRLANKAPVVLRYNSVRIRMFEKGCVSRVMTNGKAAPKFPKQEKCTDFSVTCMLKKPKEKDTIAHSS